MPFADFFGRLRSLRSDRRLVDALEVFAQSAGDQVFRGVRIGPGTGNLEIMFEDENRQISTLEFAAGTGMGGSLTASQIVAAIEGLSGTARLSYTALKDTPTIPTALTAAQIVALLQALAGTDRLPASAVQGLPVGLPAFPATGSRDNLVPKFDGNVLGWEVDADSSGSRRSRLAATAIYTPATNTIALTFPDPQTTVWNIGDQIAFLGPDNLDDSTAPVLIDDTVRTNRAPDRHRRSRHDGRRSPRGPDLHVHLHVQ